MSPQYDSIAGAAIIQPTSDLALPPLAVTQLTAIPDDAFSHLTCLEVLRITISKQGGGAGYTAAAALPRSLANLHCLRELVLMGCGAVTIELAKQLKVRFVPTLAVITVTANHGPQMACISWLAVAAALQCFSREMTLWMHVHQYISTSVHDML